MTLRSKNLLSTVFKGRVKIWCDICVMYSVISVIFFVNLFFASFSVLSVNKAKKTLDLFDFSVFSKQRIFGPPCTLVERKRSLSFLLIKEI